MHEFCDNVPSTGRIADVAVMSEKEKGVYLDNMANMFEEASSKTDDAKLIAKWLVGDVSALLNKDNIEIDESNLSPENFGKLIERISDTTISGKIGRR